MVLAGAAAGYGGDRRRPVTEAAVRGSRRAVGLSSEGRGESCRPQRRDPRVNPGRLRRVTLAAHSLSTARARPCCSRPGPSGPARRRCALEAVEKVVTAASRHYVLSRLMLAAFFPFLRSPSAPLPSSPLPPLSPPLSPPLPSPPPPFPPSLLPNLAPFDA